MVAQVQDAVDKGARVLCGGQVPDGAGWWYPPTVVTDLNPRMRTWSEEVFGPAAGPYRVSSFDEAMAIANDVDHGLGANAWTSDPDEQQRFIEGIEAGMAFVNGMTVSHPHLPFGGIKRSGYGRELSRHGIREFCNVKTVRVGDAHGGAPSTAGTHAGD